MKFSFRLLNENPVQRLGATGATEVSYLFPFDNGVYLQIVVLHLHKMQQYDFFRRLNAILSSRISVGIL